MIPQRRATAAACAPVLFVGAVLHADAESATRHHPVGLVMVESGPRRSCPGALVAHRTVLTAFHCVAGVPASSLIVRAPHSPAGSPVLRVASPLRCLYHGPTYDPGTDLAVLELAAALPVTPLKTGGTQEGVAGAARRLTVLRARRGPGDETSPSGDFPVSRLAVRAERFDGPLLWSAPVTSAGDSGSPVLNEQGELVAIVTGQGGPGAGSYSLYLSVEGHGGVTGCGTDGPRPRRGER